MSPDDEMLTFEAALAEAREKAQDEGRNPTLRELLEEAQQEVERHRPKT